jgi:hypothetical protein
MNIKALGTALKNKVNFGLDVLSRGVSKASMLPQLTQLSQIISAKSTMQKFVNVAASDQVLAKKYAAQLGLDDELQDKVSKALRTYAKTEKGMFTGKKLKSIDWDRWMSEDPESADAFRYAVVRATNKIIQRQLAGELPEFMSKVSGRLMFQFMSFSMAAWEKKTLNLLYRRDVETALAAAYTSALSGMVYTARTYGKSLVQEDPEAYRREHLSQEAIIKASLQMGGYSSIVPQVMDTTLAILREDPVFNQYARTSGLGTTPYSSNPTVSLFKNTGKTVGALYQEATNDGRQIDRKDVRAMTNLLPARTLPVMNLIYEDLINEVPE